MTDHEVSQERPNRSIAAFQYEFSGPLPPPQILKQFDEIVPGSAERILKMAESQSAHRRDLEGRVIRSDIINSKLGLVFGLLIGLGGIISATIIAINGQSWAGGIIGTLTIGSLVGTFVYGSQQRGKERTARRESKEEGS